MKERHVVLRSTRTSVNRAFRGLGTGSSLGVGTEAVPVGMRVEIEDVERSRASALERHSDVLAVAPSMPMTLIKAMDVAPANVAALPSVAWGVEAVKADTSPFTGDGIVVAVLDTGIASGHAAFQGVELTQKDFTGTGDGDTNGHGTHCAGTIFGRKVGNTRIGVAPGVKKALIGKVIGPNGGGSDAIVRGINWAVDNGANVISMSIGIDFPGYVDFLVTQHKFPPALATSRALEGYRQNVMLFERVAAMIRALAPVAQPCLLVGAAGNESRRKLNPDFEIAVSPPAVAEGNISVAALEKGNGSGMKVADFSNTGAIVSGPGVNILSAGTASTTALVEMNGTSMAAPHVAGVAALWGEQLRKTGQLNGVGWTARLVGSAVTSGLHSPFDPMDCGAGLVQAPQN